MRTPDEVRQSFRDSIDDYLEFCQERVNRRRFVTRVQARADIFDYIELFHNPAKRRKMETPNRTKSP